MYYSPIKQETYIWQVEYENSDKSTSEYIDIGMGFRRMDFDIIKKDVLKRVGMIGEGEYFYYNANDGRFNIFNDIYEFRYYNELENKEYVFNKECDKKYNDIIIYKTMEELVSPNNLSNITKSTSCYSFGYKTIVDDISFKPIFNINIAERKLYFTVRFASPKYINGEFRVYKNGNLVDTTFTDLRENVGKIFTWNL